MPSVLRSMSCSRSVGLGTMGVVSIPWPGLPWGAGLEVLDRFMVKDGARESWDELPLDSADMGEVRLGMPLGGRPL